VLVRVEGMRIASGMIAWFVFPASSVIRKLPYLGILLCSSLEASADGVQAVTQVGPCEFEVRRQHRD
jgi:hypothetical protein